MDLNNDSQYFAAIGYIRRNIGAAACYEQLAEEASELAQAALKYARILRGVNPTPVPKEEAAMMLEEEYIDVQLAADVASVHANNRNLYLTKLQRWVDRIEEWNV